MNGIKKLLVLSVVMLMAVMAQADEMAACIYHNGVFQEKVLLSKKPVLKMEEMNIIIPLDENQILEIPAVGTVVEFENVESDPTSINHASVAQNVPVYKISNGSVAVSGLKHGDVVRIYTTAGVQISTATADGNGCVLLPVGKGVMILNAGKTSMKLIIK